MELALPITVYWDLASATPLDATLLRLCDEIVACRPLMLQLYDPSPLLAAGTRGILERFKGSGIAVSLTLIPSCLASIAAAPDSPLAELAVKELLVACDSLAAFRALPILPEVGLAFFTTPAHWRQLPQVVALCRERGVTRLVLPMQRLYQGEEPFLLDKGQQELLGHELIAVGGTDGLRLTIHDPFLWRAFNPQIPFPQAGCQAANTMIAISPAGGVYPCPTLPVRIGEIGSTSLKEIISSPVKKELRQRITGQPAACDGCRELAVCRGGCRGRAYVRHGSLDAIDDACR